MTLNISLSPHLENFVRGQISAGRFHSASDMVNAALALLEEQGAQSAWLRQEIDRGIASGTSAEDITPVFWEKLRRRLQDASDR